MEDPYKRQRNYQARIRAKAQMFDDLNGMRLFRVRRQIAAIRKRGAMTETLDRMLPYFLSFPQCQTVIHPVLSEDVKTLVRSYSESPDRKTPTWVAHGDDWDVGVAAYAFRREFPEEPFRFVGMLRGREMVYETSQDYATNCLDPEMQQHESLMRENGLWVTE